ncbi:GDSL-type esterase/lipase family protein [Sphingomonas sp.]|uniref:GDSL-type esterase/lipase family protein n=1 Tax=Sphingomonas sp. TaxID=28214 RepID=UPI003B00485F
MALTRLLVAVALAGTATGAIARAAQWVPAWGAAQMRSEGADADRLASAGPSTIRQIVHLAAGGRILRVRLSNVASDTPLHIGAVSLARGAAGRAAVTDLRPLTFDGATSVVIPAGAEIYADPVTMVRVAPGDDIAISLYLPDSVPHRTGHPGARATAFLASGDVTGAADLPAAQRIGGWWSLADVEVDGGPQSGAIVAIGDSITDGYGVRDDGNARWPDLLARRLATDPATRTLSVVNAGIGGNRVLLDGVGPSLLARFDRDVIARAAVRYAIVLEGVNDLGTLTRDQPATPAQHSALVAAIIAAYRQVVVRAHAHGVRVIGGTIMPFVGNDYYHAGPDSESDRQAINTFIRSAGAFDGVVDFDRALRDPAHPDRLLAAYDSGDHLHPSEAGYRAMADAIPLSLFGDARASAVAARRPQIAITFDDLPAHGPLPPGGDRLAVAQAIIAALRSHDAPAFGFLNQGFATGEPRAPAVLAAWRAAGLPIGNHTFSHLNLDMVGAAAFLADAHRNESSLAAIAGPDDGRWFRYPFLLEGSGPAVRDAVRADLRRSAYRVAAVTMSFGDYAWNDAYARCVARHDGSEITALEASFLAAAKAQALRSRLIARQALGRDIPYVLLMHLGAFDAHMLPRLLSLYEEMGFAFTTLPKAESDPFYAAAVDLALPGSSPTLEAAASAKGLAIPANAPLPGPTVCT